MQAGQLRRRITIEKKVTDQDAAGQEKEQWYPYAQRWAAIEPLTGREKLAAEQVDAELSHKITMRYLSGVVAKMRIKYGTRYFDIRSVMNIKEQGAQLELMATEKV